jgi:hypothetical protein
MPQETDMTDTTKAALAVRELALAETEAVNGGLTSIIPEGFERLVANFTEWDELYEMLAGDQAGKGAKRPWDRLHHI